VRIARRLTGWRHPRFKMHFTPTSSSWLNLVERFFADLTEDVIRSGSFASVTELVREIKAYLADRTPIQSRRRRNPRQDQARPRRTRQRRSSYVTMFESQDTSGLFGAERDLRLRRRTLLRPTDCHP
jgi:hypothetical protein